VAEVILVVNSKVGLHARPAALFVQTASKFKSAITVWNGEKRANAKSMLNLLTLGVLSGTAIRVTAEGEDAEQALAALVELNATNFGEPA